MLSIDWLTAQAHFMGVIPYECNGDQESHHALCRQFDDSTE